MVDTYTYHLLLVVLQTTPTFVVQSAPAKPHVRVTATDDCVAPLALGTLSETTPKSDKTVFYWTAQPRWCCTAERMHVKVFEGLETCT